MHTNIVIVIVGYSIPHTYWIIIMYVGACALAGLRLPRSVPSRSTPTVRDADILDLPKFTGWLHKVVWTLTNSWIWATRRGTSELLGDFEHVCSFPTYLFGMRKLTTSYFSGKTKNVTKQWKPTKKQQITTDQDLMELFCARQRRKFSRGIKRASGCPRHRAVRLMVDSW